MLLYPCIMMLQEVDLQEVDVDSVQISKYPCEEPNKWYCHLNTHFKMTGCIAASQHEDIWIFGYLAFPNV